ncbi:UNKNOWN [Stylonychia lemnae]|uniref:Uncharacterized protein n=1 Tax=Stylonychia lemnae TaxID=5949 RepID=A0A078AMZ8_STYLE|nr:UNKNOWN [Stylonychia lemnae]|eukprot:CDW83306.1 UNKNOWN [Stylonychia lemnae]
MENSQQRGNIFSAAKQQSYKSKTPSHVKRYSEGSNLFQIKRSPQNNNYQFKNIIEKLVLENDKNKPAQDQEGFNNTKNKNFNDFSTNTKDMRGINQVQSFRVNEPKWKKYLEKENSQQKAQMKVDYINRLDDDNSAFNYNYKAEISSGIYQIKPRQEEEQLNKRLHIFSEEYSFRRKTSQSLIEEQANQDHFTFNRKVEQSYHQQNQSKNESPNNYYSRLTTTQADGEDLHFESQELKLSDILKSANMKEQQLLFSKRSSNPSSSQKDSNTFLSERKDFDSNNNPINDKQSLKITPFDLEKQLNLEHVNKDPTDQDQYDSEQIEFYGWSLSPKSIGKKFRDFESNFIALDSKEETTPFISIKELIYGLNESDSSNQGDQIGNTSNDMKEFDQTKEQQIGLNITSGSVNENLLDSFHVQNEVQQRVNLCNASPESQKRAQNHFTGFSDKLQRVANQKSLNHRVQTYNQHSLMQFKQKAAIGQQNEVKVYSGQGVLKNQQQTQNSSTTYQRFLYNYQDNNSQLSTNMNSNQLQQQKTPHDSSRDIAQQNRALGLSKSSERFKNYKQPNQFKK